MYVLCIVGPANSGKTRLIEELLPALRARGLRVATVKHTCHRDVAIDTPGKDTYRHRQAGAEVVGLATPEGVSILTEHKGLVTLAAIVSCFPQWLDILLVEGFKKEDFPKIELVPEGSSSLFGDDERVIALVSPSVVPRVKVPLFAPTDTTGLTDFLVKRTMNRNDYD